MKLNSLGLLRYRRTSVCVFGLSTSLLAVFAFFLLREHEYEKIKIDFSLAAQTRLSVLQNEIELNLEVLQGLRSLYDSSETVTRDEFSIFAQEAIRRRPGIQTLEWIPRIKDAIRESHESSGQTSGYAYYQISEQGQQGKMIRAGDREEYFPVYYVEPYKGNESALGFDLASYPTRLKAINKSRDTGTMVATDRIKLVQERGEQLGFLVLMPVYDHEVSANSVEERRQNLAGFATGVFKINAMIKISTMYLEDKKINLYLFEQLKSTEKQFLGSLLSDGRKQTSASADYYNLTNSSGLQLEVPLKVVDKTWLLVCQAGPGFVEQRRGLLSWMVLISGVLFSFFISGYLKITSDRAAENEQFVAKLSLESSERKKVEKELRKSEEKFRKITFHANDAIIMMDAEGKISFWNETAENMFGYQNQEALGKFSHALIVPERHRELFSIGYKNLQKTGTGSTFGKILELAGLKKDQTEFPIELSISTVQLADTWNAIWIIRDMTERMQAQKKQKKLQDQLRQAHKLEAVGTLAGGIAHDFNNILAAIIGFAEVAIDKTVKDSSLHDNLNEILTAGYRARDLVSQILTSSRESKQELKPIQSRLVIKEGVKMLRATLPATIEIIQNINSDAHILADVTQIHQVLINICTNAADAMQAEGGKLEISLEDEELDAEFVARHSGSGAGAYQRLTIRDMGHGIAPGIMENIFDPFFTTKAKTRGTGMGLAVVHGIVKSHGGILSVYSEQGQGTKFDIYFPITDSRNKPAVKSESSISKNGSERILFVDDEKALVDLGKLILEEHGYKVTTRTSSIEALELFKAKPNAFDMVVTDMTMPNMTGMELIDRITQIRPDIPVMLVSGFSPIVNAEKAKAAGVYAFLDKPIMKVEMLANIRQALDQRIFN